MRQRSRYALAEDIDPFTDLLFNALLGFTFLLFVVLMFINPPAKDGTIDAKAEVIITATWPGDLSDDIDAWVQGPDGETVSFRTPESGLMHLDRDDRGLVSDTVLIDGVPVTVPLNQEVVTLRGTQAGEYVVNLHRYQAAGSGPVPVEVTVVRVNPALEVVFTGTVELAAQGSEKTVLRFQVRPDGRIGALSRLAKSLVEAK